MLRGEDGRRKVNGERRKAEQDKARHAACSKGIALCRGSARRVLGPIPRLNGCGSVSGPYIASASSQYTQPACAPVPSALG